MLAFSDILQVAAYVKLNYYFYAPRNIKVSISPFLEYYVKRECIDTWKDKTKKVEFTYNSDTWISSNNFVMFEEKFEINNGAYATTYFDDFTRTIVLYEIFLSTSIDERNETVVHEIGHALGLDHILESQDQSSAVMRARGFNGKAFPLADGIAGIKDIYKKYK